MHEIIKLKKNSGYLIILLYSIFLFSKIQTRLEIPLFNDNYVILGYCAIITIISIISINKNGNLLNKKLLFLISLLLTYTVIFTVVFYKEELSNNLENIKIALAS